MKNLFYMWLFFIWFIISFLVAFATCTKIANAGDGQFNIFNANSLTGGGYALDGISSSTYLDTGDIAITGIEGDNVYFHIYDESNSESESSPNIIIPDDNSSGTGAWELTYAYAQTGNTKTVSIILLPDDATLVTGNGFANLPFYVPESLNGWRLTNVSAAVAEASISGKPTFQVHNQTDSVDMLSTRITIDENELHSSTATDSPDINSSYRTVVTGDKIRFDCDVAGNGAKGAQIDLTFSTQ